MLVFERRETPDYLEKNLLEQGQTKNQLNPHDAGSENQTRDTMGAGKCPHHYAILVFAKVWHLP